MATVLVVSSAVVLQATITQFLSECDSVYSRAAARLCREINMAARHALASDV